MSHKNRSAFGDFWCDCPRLLFGILSPLVGAVVGGLTTLMVAKETIQDQSTVNAYSHFASEVARIVRLAREGSQTEHDLARLEGAVGILMLHGSDEAICWSFQIMSRVAEPGIKVNIGDDFLQMLLSMRQEVGTDPDEDIKVEECPSSLM